MPPSSPALAGPDSPEVIAYTDGCCLGNPGPGGYGVVLMSGGNRKELSGGFHRTTNNRMEMLAAIVALEVLKEPCRIKLHSDSQYVIKAMTEGWAEKWKSRGWRTASNAPAANPDLWERMLRARIRHRIEWKWVKGHSGVVENERCDQLANAAAKGDLQEDVGYVGNGANA